MNKRVLIGLLLIAVCLTLFCRQCISQNAGNRQKKNKFDIEVPEGTDKPIRFYGKVVDQQGDPVAGAEVIAEIKDYRGAFLSMGFGEVETVRTLTDSEGCFMLKGKGIYIGLSPIKKGGYEWQGKPSIRFYHKSEDPSEIITSNPDAPAVFRLRRFGHPAYLTKISKKITCNRGEDVETSFGVAKDWITSEGKPKSRYSSGRHKDIKVSVSTAGDGKSYDVTFSSLDEDSGMILSDDLLYEAPEDGYVTEIKVNLNVPGDIGRTERYIYVRARAGAMYSRLKVVFDLTNATELRINITGLTNPDGSRNLEYDSNYQFSEEKWRKEIDERRDKEKDKAKNEKRKFDEEAFMKKIRKEKAERDEKEKKENSKWWHKLEDEKKDKDKNAN